MFKKFDRFVEGLLMAIGPPKTPNEKAYMDAIRDHQIAVMTSVGGGVQQVVGPTGPGMVGGIPGQWRDPYSNRVSHMGMLALRMRWDNVPHEVHHVAQKANGTFVLFLILGDEAVLIEDDAHLFPSDGLITKLRTLLP